MKKLLIGLTALVLLTGAGCAEERDCLKGEMRMVHHDSYTTFMATGKTMTPIYHPARDTNEFFCLEYAPE